MLITVIGTGYVGLVSAVCLAELGHQVIGVDSDTEKIAALAQGESPIYEALVKELLQRHNGKRLRFSVHPKAAVAASDVIFLAVGTPPAEDGSADLSQMEMVAMEIAPVVHRSTLIVEKSTVPVGTCEGLCSLLRQNGAQAGWFSVACNPEFLREGSAVVDFLYPDRIVVGADDELGQYLLREVYRPLTSGSYYRREDAVPCPGRRRDRARMILTHTKSAELIKHTSNAFLAMKISYINKVAEVAEGAGADIDEIRAGVGSDSRIGEQCMGAGIGYGGSCFPKDVVAFEAAARQHGVDFGILREVSRTNLEQRSRFIERVRRSLGPLPGKRLGVLGLAFKEDTDDIRESPAIAIVAELAKQGAILCAYDPAAMARARRVLAGGQVTFAHDAYDAAAGCEALLILTPWRQFVNLDLQRLHSVMRSPVIFDGRSLYAPEEMAAAGFVYHSVGRAPSLPMDLGLPAAKRFVAARVPVGEKAGPCESALALD